jgi:hypothetical protein
MRARKCRDISAVRDQRDVRIAGRRRNAVPIHLRDAGRQALVDVALVDEQEIAPLLGIQAADAMSLSLTDAGRCDR